MSNRDYLTTWAGPGQRGQAVLKSQHYDLRLVLIQNPNFRYDGHAQPRMLQWHGDALIRRLSNTGPRQVQNSVAIQDYQNPVPVSMPIPSSPRRTLPLCTSQWMIRKHHAQIPNHIPVRTSTQQWTIRAKLRPAPMSLQALTANPNVRTSPATLGGIGRCKLQRGWISNGESAAEGREMEGDVERTKGAMAGGETIEQRATRARTGVPSEGELGRQTLTGRGWP